MCCGSDLLLLGSDLLKPLEHAEHDEHGHEGDDHEDQPAHPQAGQRVEEEWADHDKQVADGGGAKSEALADTLDMFRGNLGNKAQTQRTNKQFSNC